VTATATLRSPAVTAIGDALPLAAGVAPFGVSIGTTIATTGTPPLAGLSGAPLLMAGASQLAAIELVDRGAAIAIAVIAALVINLRFVLYGGGLNRWFPDLATSRKLLLAVPLVDQLLILCEQRFEPRQQPLRWRLHYYLTVWATLFAAFGAGQIAGYLAGATLPPTAGLHLIAPLVFAGLLAKAVSDRRSRTAAAVAGGIVIATSGLPAGVPLLLGAAAGLMAGTRATGPAAGGARP
jgi:predicted branched-subunit amino acid permease